MKQRIPKHFKISKYILLTGIALAALTWIFDSFIHTYSQPEISFIQRLFPIDSPGIWVRLFMVAMIISFSLYVQSRINKLKEESQENRFALKEFKQILNTTAYGIRVIDKDFNVLRVNDTFSTLSGVSRGEAEGSKCYEVFGGPLCNNPGCSLEQIKNGEKQVEFDVEKKRRDGSGISCTLTTVPLKDDDGNLQGIVQSFKNISEYEIARQALKEIEERYRTLQKNIPLGVFRSTPQGRIITANPAMVRIFGCCSEEEMCAIPASAFYLDLKQRQELLEILREKGVVSGFEVQMKRKDGSTFWCSFYIKAVTDKEGKITFHDGIIEDISQHKKMEEELIKSEKLESIGILAGGIAHDFNNILTSILVNIGFIRMNINKEGRTMTKLKETEKAVLRAKALTQRLLTFSDGGAPLIGPASIRELLKDTADFALSGTHVRCKYSIPDNLRNIEIDEGQISQAIRNLVINAEQAMPEGGLIHIAAENVTIESDNGSPLDEGNYIKITVKDQGKGIPEERLDKIFDPFFTTKEKNSGLGLSIAYSIIKKHNGWITVESQPGDGSTFYIYLPASWEKVKSVRGESQKRMTGYGKVLLMDDESLILESTGDMLQAIGYSVEKAKDGSEVIKMYEEARQAGNPFDVVLLDLIIPGGMGGQDTIRELLRIDPGVKAVVSSGYSADPIMAKHKEYGFVNALSKPYRMRDLSSVLREAVSTHQGLLN